MRRGAFAMRTWAIASIVGLAIVSATAGAGNPPFHVRGEAAAVEQVPLQLRLGLLDDLEDPNSSALVSLMRLPIRDGAAAHASPVPAFRIPLDPGTNLHPAGVLVEEYAPVPAPWVHVHVYCAIYQGVAYLRGSITGNFGRPLPGVTEYFGRGDSVIGTATANLAGRFNVALSGPPSPMLPDMARTPMKCMTPNVQVGYASRAQ